MPMYDFRDKETDERSREMLSISDKEKFLADNPHLEQVFGALSIVDPTRAGRVKPDEGFRDVLRNIKRRNPGSNVNTF